MGGIDHIFKPLVMPNTQHGVWCLMRVEKIYVDGNEILTLKLFSEIGRLKIRCQTVINTPDVLGQIGRINVYKS